MDSLQHFKAVGTLQRYPWPGNVRAMENVIERAMIISGRDQILPQDLPFDLTLNAPLPTTFAEIEKQAILSTLRANTGHHKKTADQLGISLRTLQYRLKEYGQ